MGVSVGLMKAASRVRVGMLEGGGAGLREGVSAGTVTQKYPVRDADAGRRLGKDGRAGPAATLVAFVRHARAERTCLAGGAKVRGRCLPRGKEAARLGSAGLGSGRQERGRRSRAPQHPAGCRYDTASRCPRAGEGRGAAAFEGGAKAPPGGGDAVVARVVGMDGSRSRGEARSVYPRRYAFTSFVRSRCARGSPARELFARWRSGAPNSRRGVATSGAPEVWGRGACPAVGGRLSPIAWGRTMPYSKWRLRIGVSRCRMRVTAEYEGGVAGAAGQGPRSQPSPPRGSTAAELRSARSTVRRDTLKGTQCSKEERACGSRKHARCSSQRRHRRTRVAAVAG